ncbi:MAG: mycofactocin system GMC family oxidoreductase MftG [Chloroflexota bacterium]
MQPQSHFNYIIIGAGSAGAILAARLSKDPSCQVLLLEAGPDYPHMALIPEEIKFRRGSKDNLEAKQTHDWGYQAAVTTETADIHLPRGKVTGGSSAINGMVFLRGESDDYNSWADAGNDRWSFDEVLPYFRKIETDINFPNEHHGIEGPTPVYRYPATEWTPDQSAFYEACRAAGIPDCPDLNQTGSTGVGAYPLNMVDGIRYSTAITYLNPVRHRANLTILAERMAYQILFSGKRAVGVEVKHAGEKEAFSCDEVIVSAGGIGSPQLLMLSGIGPAEGLQQLEIPVLVDLPGVGQNLRDHMTVEMHWHLEPDFVIDPSKHGHQVGLRYTASNSNLVNDMIVYQGTRFPNRIYLMRPTVNLALSSGELQLASTDPKVQPILNMRYYDHPFDRMRQREAIRMCIELAHHHSFEGIIANRIKPTDVDLASDESVDAYIMREATTGHHASSTCKMGPNSDPLSVVDQFGRVHGVEGLRVVDASIMPDSVRANINACVLMIGERMADLIRE